jgi:hypothetical protein
MAHRIGRRERDWGVRPSIDQPRALTAPSMEFDMPDTEASDSQARRAATRIGLRARKSRLRRDTIDNYGHYMLIDPWRNFVIAGFRFDLTADDVVDWCSRQGVSKFHD